MHLKILKKVIDELIIDSFSSKIVVKSTILPSNLREFEDIKSSLVFNPEFLREKTANEDFINSEFIPERNEVFLKVILLSEDDINYLF